jgi:hypothetical protein
MDSIDGDGVRLARAREWRSAGTKRGGVAPGMDRSTGDGSRAQPAVRLRHQLHQASRARLRHVGEPLYARVVPPLWGGASQLRPQRDCAGGHLRQRLRGVPGDPRELGPLGPLVPHRAAHARHGQDTGAPGGARRRPVDRAAGLMQRVVPVVHDDIQQRGVGEGWFYLRNDGVGLPPTPARC